MTLGEVLRIVGLALAIVAFASMILVLVEADATVAIFCLMMTCLGLGLYCVGCLIPEATDDPTL